MKAHIQAVNQLRAVTVTAPDELRERLRALAIDKVGSHRAAVST
jgi:post-segregation antitoxin (ccd killing protein)